MERRGRSGPSSRPILLGAAVFAAIGILTTALAAAGAREERYLTVDEALATVFPRADRVVKARRVLRPAEMKALEKELRRPLPEGGYYVFAGFDGDRIDAYAFITNEVGKTDPFTFLVAVEPEGTVRDVLVLVYREMHGSEIRQPRFLRQLRGKKKGDPFRINQDVVNVSGATLSCRAIAAGVKKILAVADLLYLSRDPREVLAEIEREGERHPLERSGPVRSEDPGPTDPDRTASVPSRPSDDDRTASRGPVVQERYVMGTLCRATLYAASRAAAREAAERAFAEIRRVDALLSDYRADSELSLWNARPGAGRVAVSGELYGLLEAVRAHHRESDGAFDPTVGPLLELWGLRTPIGDCGPTRTAPPSPGEISKALDRIGFDRLRFHEDGHEIECGTPGLGLDPGGFGKGYALDRAAEILRREGVKAALLDFGSTAIAVGAPPGSVGWEFGIRDPGASDTPVARVVLRDRAVSTSGGYEKHVEIRGETYSHILDPRTGRPAEHAVSVSVIADGALEADIRSTAAAVLGPDAGAAYLATAGTPGFFLRRDDGTGALVRRATEQWRTDPATRGDE